MVSPVCAVHSALVRLVEDVVGVRGVGQAERFGYCAVELVVPVHHAVFCEVVQVVFQVAGHAVGFLSHEEGERVGLPGDVRVGCFVKRGFHPPTADSYNLYNL